MMIKDDLMQALDPVLFASEQLGFEPDKWQADVLRWDGKRLLLNCCRQSGKSTTAAILALHRALFYPKSLILLISPSLRQSSELGKKITDEIAKLEIQPKRLENNKLSLQLENRSRIICLPSSESTIRGYSEVDLIIEDEASRVSDELYYSCRPMLAVSNGKLILMSTPLGKRGHFHAAWENGGESWERVKITADEVSRISKEFLEDEKEALGEWWFSQEYLCQFRENVDQLFTYDQVMKAFDNDLKPLVL